MGKVTRNYYQVLGVPSSAPPEAIQQAYRKVIVRAACSTGPEAWQLREELRLAREAFAVLMNPDKRAAYDTGCLGLRPEHADGSRRGILGFWLGSAA
jgi:molecular chaperone DnaJ